MAAVLKEKTRQVLAVLMSAALALLMVPAVPLAGATAWADEAQTTEAGTWPVETRGGDGFITGLVYDNYGSNEETALQVVSNDAVFDTVQQSEFDFTGLEAAAKKAVEGTAREAAEGDFGKQVEGIAQAEADAAVAEDSQRMRDAAVEYFHDFGTLMSDNKAALIDAAATQLGEEGVNVDKDSIELVGLELLDEDAIVNGTFAANEVKLLEEECHVRDDIDVTPGEEYSVDSANFQVTEVTSDNENVVKVGGFKKSSSDASFTMQAGKAGGRLSPSAASTSRKSRATRPRTPRTMPTPTRATPIR